MNKGSLTVKERTKDLSCDKNEMRLPLNANIQLR